MKTSFGNKIARKAQTLLLINEIRIFYGLLRYFFYHYALRYNKTYSSPEQEHLGVQTFDYNYKKIVSSIMKHERVRNLIYPVLAIGEVNRKLPFMKTLSIGPRSEGELLLISAFGFSWKNIHGLDLFSYSPRIDVADMHDMPYKDNTFDIIFSGWTLAYSDDQEKALKEMVRVLKPGGYISLGQGFDGSLGEKDGLPGSVGTTLPRKNTIKEIFGPIKDNIDHYYFQHDITPEMMKEGDRAIVAVLSIKK